MLTDGRILRCLERESTRSGNSSVAEIIMGWWVVEI